MMIEMDNEEESSIIEHDKETNHTAHGLTAEQLENMVDNPHVEEPKQMDESSPAEENESAEVIRDFASAEDAVDEKEPLIPELEEAWKILNSFLRNTKLTGPFIDEVFTQLTESEIEKYKELIPQPMCLSRMEEKFKKREYESITQVVDDFTLMVYNCLRFNGTNHPISKQAEKIQTILKQKLHLLRHDIRCKVSQDNFRPWATKEENKNGGFISGLRRRTANHRHDDSAMLNQLRMEEERKAKEERKLKKEQQRAVQLAAHEKLLNWEEENLTAEPIKSVIRHSWELPQIGLFLFLCRNQLMLEEVPMYELERCLAMARQSKRLQKIMTALFSTPSQREKRWEKNSPDMSYSEWSQKLADVVAVWYKVLTDCGNDKRKAAMQLGFDERCFEVFGMTNPLREKQFHSLSFYKKIWILKCVCDHLVENQECFRSCIEAQDPQDQRGLVLGSDRNGCQYVHFPQFCGPNLRIYKQRKPTVPVIEEEEEEDEEVEKVSRKTPSKGKSKTGAKRKLNLGVSNDKRSRSATPLNDCETDGTASPAPSDTMSKSRASSSRHSSPLPRETNGRSQQASARNSPVPESSFLDSLISNSSSSKGRKTRNSAESSFFNVDLELLFRRKNRRGKTAKNGAKETADTESGSNVGDESSQDGLPVDTSGNGVDGEVKTGNEQVNDKLAETETDHSQRPIPEEVKDNVKQEDNVTKQSDICSENGGREVDTVECVKKELDNSPCNKETPAQHDDKSMELCDIPEIKVETQVPTSASSVNCESDCVSTTQGNPHISQKSTFTSTPTAGGTCSIKTEITGDDSGFDSFQLSPRPSKSDGNGEEDSKKCSGSLHDIPDKYTCVSSGVLKNEPAFEVDPTHPNVDVKKEEAVEKTEKSPQPAADSNAACSNDLQASHSALMDHDAYSEEEMVPDQGEFEMIVEDMDGLEKLVKKFDPEHVEAPPSPPPQTHSGRIRQKSKLTSNTVKRNTNEIELHERLQAMYSELQQYRSKLASLTKKAQLKLQREFQSFVEEEPKVDAEKAWETGTDSDKNSESGVEESCLKEEDTEDSQDVPSEPLPSANKKKAPSKPSSLESVDSPASDSRDIEEYEADVSSRGRLRKRRVIPNNAEDPPIKKKKVLKKEEEEVPVTSASQISSVIQRSEDGSITVNMSDSEFLEMMKQGGASQLVQQLAAVNNPAHSIKLHPQGIRVEKTGVKPGISQSSAHPVMQKILSSQVPGNSRQPSNIFVQKINTSSPSGLTRTVALSVVSTSTETAPSTSGTGVGAGQGMRSPILMTTPLKGGKQQVFMVTPKEQEELIGSGVLRHQGQQQVVQAGRVVVPSGNNSGGRMLTAALGKPTVAARHVTVLQAPQQAAPSRILSPQGVGQVMLTPTGKSANPTNNAHAVPVQRFLQLPALGNPASSAAAGGTTGAAGNLQSVMVNGKEIVRVPVSVPLPGPSQAVPRSGGPRPPMIVNKSNGNRTLVFYGQSAIEKPPRYASNVTVKTLLENRAASKAEESSKGAESEASGAGGVSSGSSVVTSTVSTVSTPRAILPANMFSGAQAASLAVRLPSNSTLDDALQSVVTSYHTTLPTADIKVPSPTTLPSLSPRKNVTRTVPSSKAPIPTTTKVQTHTHLVRAATIVPRNSVMNLGPSIGGLVPGRSVVRPGTVVVPSGTQLSCMNASSNKQPLVMQVVPSGGRNVVQSYVVPQGSAAIQSLQSANVATTQARPSLIKQAMLAVPTPSTQMLNKPVLSLANAGAVNLKGSQVGQDFAVSSAPNPSSSGTSQQTTTSRTTSEVLKSMLAAKVQAMGGSVPSISGSSVVAESENVASPAGAAKVAAAGSGLVQQNVAQLTQVPRIIKAQMAGTGAVMTNTQPSAVVGQAGFTVLPQVQQQGLLAGRILTTTAPVGAQVQSLPSLAVARLSPSNSSNVVATDTAAQRNRLQNVVHVSLPAGLQLAGLQPGATTVRLVAADQSGSGPLGQAQPVLATIRPGTHGSHQLHLLASSSNLQQAQVAHPQQQITVKGAEQIISGQSGSSPSTDKQQTVQLCFKMQPGMQGAVGSAIAPVIPHPVLQGAGIRAVLPTSKGSFSGLGSSSESLYSSATVPKVIMASSAISTPISATLQQNSPVNIPAVNSALGSQLSLSVTPSSANLPNTSISPQSVDNSNKTILQRQLCSTQMETVPSNVHASLKRRLMPDSAQPAAPKKACLETTGGNSGAVLASLSQLVGTMKSSTSQAAGDAPITSLTRETAGSSMPRIVMASNAGGDNSASSTLLNLAAHVAPASGILPVAASIKSPNSIASAVSYPSAQTANMTQFLQQIAAGAPGGQAQQQQAPPQQQMMAVRRVGGQLLTDHNIPVVENNGEYKVLPKATLQLGSQTVTVLSPSNALVQNVKSLVTTPESSVPVPALLPSSTVVMAGAVPSSVNSGAAAIKTDGGQMMSNLQELSSDSSHEMIMNIVKQELNQRASLSTSEHTTSSEVQTSKSTSGTNAVKSESGQESGADAVKSEPGLELGATAVNSEPGLEDVLPQQQKHSMPVLKARLEQPVVSHMSGQTSLCSTVEAVRVVSSGQQKIGDSQLAASGGEVSVRNQSPQVTAADSVQRVDMTDGKSSHKVEEEAALNLLTLANQAVL